MIITINTKEDSHEEIKDTIRILQKLVDKESPVFSNQNIQDTVQSKAEANKNTEEKEVVNLFANLMDNEENINEEYKGAKKEERFDVSKLVVTDKNSRYDTRMAKESEIPKPIKANTEEIIRIIEY